jgi:hypothetical protein
MRVSRMLVLAILPFALIGAREAVRAMRPIAAGIWYPADKEQLRADVRKYMNETEAAAPQGRVVACIVPHAPYETSGAIAGAAFKLLQPGQYDRVIVLAPAHYSKFRGCSIPSVQAYRTPLGDVILDGPTIRALDRSTLIEVRAVHYTATIERAQLHEREYTIEVVLPFLQERLGEFLLVPLAVGDFLDYQNRTDENAISAVAETIGEYVDDRTLLVVSSDFTHFGNNFSYRPFRENILEGIEALDRQAFSLILKRDYRGFLAYLEETGNTICGKNAIAILLKLLPKRAEGRLLQYEISARKTGDTRTSISFASIVFCEPGSPGPREQKESANHDGHR